MLQLIAQHLRNPGGHRSGDRVMQIGFDDLNYGVVRVDEGRRLQPGTIILTKDNDRLVLLEHRDGSYTWLAKAWFGTWRRFDEQKYENSGKIVTEGPRYELYWQ